MTAPLIPHPIPETDAERAAPAPLLPRVLALLATLGALTAWPLAVWAAPQSGAWCRFQHCLTYPYTDARYLGRDFWWMYPAAVAVLTFAALLAVLELSVPPRRRPGARLATLAATAGAVLVTAALTLQLAVVQPAIIKGEQDGLTFWTQYNPHGGFIALENLGYLLLSLALIAVATLVPGGGAARRTVRIAAGGLGALGVLALPVQGALLGSNLDYAYEVTAISCVWTAIVIVPLLLTRALPPHTEPGITPQ